MNVKAIKYRIAMEGCWLGGIIVLLTVIWLLSLAYPDRSGGCLQLPIKQAFPR